MGNPPSGNFQVLPWDSDFFGYKVGRILPLRLTSEEVKTTLESMKNENVTLVYWPSDPGDPESQKAARKSGGFLADRKITYVVDLERISHKNDPMKMIGHNHEFIQFEGLETLR